MAPDSTDKPNRRAAGSKLLKKILLVFAYGFGALFVVLAVFIVPDQVRPVPELNPSFGSLVRADPPEKGEPAKSANGLKHDARAAATKEIATLSPSNPLTSSTLENASPEEIMQWLRPVPDLSEIPADLRPVAEEWNREVDKITSSLLALERSAAASDYAVVRNGAERLLIETDDLRERFRQYDRYDKTPTITRLPGKTVYLFPLHGPLFGFAEENRRRWREVCMKALLLVAVVDKRWRDAANYCADQAGFSPDKNSPWWDAEVYCWRKHGAKGRVLLAVRSTIPLFLPIVRIFDKSAGEY